MKPKINVEIHSTKGLYVSIFCWYDVGILFLIAIFLHIPFKKMERGVAKKFDKNKNINLLFFNAFFNESFSETCFFI